MLGPGPRVELADVAAEKTGVLAATIRKKVRAHGASDVSDVLMLKPSERKNRLGRLFALLFTKPGEGRQAGLLQVMDDLRKELPAVLKRSPLRLTHLGFTRMEDLIKYLAAGLEEMRTSAESLPEFERGSKGWRWNFVGRLLFERLVKYHPQLDGFFRKLAGTFFRMLNEEIGKSPTTMVDAAGTPHIVTSKFGPAQKVIEFRLIGADGVERSYTDFGYISQNKQGLWAAMLVEIKMPAALKAVASQFAEFLPRLREAQKVVAILEEDSGQRQVVINPADWVFAEHDRAQVAVSPLPERQIREAFPAGQILPGQVASVTNIDMGTSERHETIYYKVRLLVIRDWLVDIARVITGP